MFEWVRSWRPRTVLTIAAAFAIASLLFVTRQALIPFVVGSALAYILLPLVTWLNDLLPQRLRSHVLWRALSVLTAYVFVVAVVAALLAFVVPPVAMQIDFLVRRLPALVRQAYQAVPLAVQRWLDTYQNVPQDIQMAIQRGIEGLIQTVISTVQAGVLKTADIVFSTVGFVIGLVVVPLWMFYILRDQQSISRAFFSAIPGGYREDAGNLLCLTDQVLAAYLRGRLLLGLGMAIMTTAGLAATGIHFALLLGTVMGILEIVPLLGPILGTIVVLFVTLATAPGDVLWVALLLFIAQQVVDYVLVPLVARGTVRLHPALVMLLIVAGSEVAGVWGLLLSVPAAALLRDAARYINLRTLEPPLSPREALLKVSARPWALRPLTVPPSED